MIQNRYLCDRCGKEIPPTGLSFYTNVELKGEPVPVIFSHPCGKAEQERWDFCDINCLRQWLLSFIKDKKKK